MLVGACLLYACIAVFFFREALFTDRVQDPRTRDYVEGRFG